MVKIKIKDLPSEQKVSKGEMKKILGGYRSSFTRIGRISKPLLRSTSLYGPFINHFTQEEDEGEEIAMQG